MLGCIALVLLAACAQYGAVRALRDGGRAATGGARNRQEVRNLFSANIIATDTFATNGVIHVIDKVILPEAP